MTSQGGQRFRRRALRRGYKVDEVDAFLDRVEAALGGDTSGTPIAAQEVHDVVFRVRFGGYDEWQVDLHLDRVERQLAELEERGGIYQRVEQRLAPQQATSRATASVGPAFEERPAFDSAPPVRDDREFASSPGREDYPTQGFPSVAAVPASPPMSVAMPPPTPASVPPAMPPQQKRSEDYQQSDPTSFASGGYDLAGRHGRMDMTAEISAVTGTYMPDEIAKVDALRRTFQPRRFGSGYDPAQVDRLFDAVLAFMTGRSSTAVDDAELDPSQFNLVHGGYFEADVESALKEVRDTLRK